MYATTQLETVDVKAEKYGIGQSAAKHLADNGMAKVQRLAGNGVGSSDPKCGANRKRPIAERFFSKVKVVDSGCHEWTGYLMPNGYGQFHKDGKTAYAHRVAWEIAHGDANAYILHKCDNRKCVNPKHLFAGSFNDNMQDMVSKCRQAHGERNGHAKLTSEQVREIRNTKGVHREICSIYGVSMTLISLIKNRRIWKYV